MRIIRFDNKGWRARFDDGFDAENVGRVADAFGYIWAEARPGATVYVGYDTRFGGRSFAGTVAGVLASYGLHAIVSDVACPTPALGWAVAHNDEAVGGVMLTASSSSCEYGGISARGEDGGPISDEFYEAAAQIMSAIPIESRGVFSIEDIIGGYLEDLRGSVNAEAIASAAPCIVVDPMYGSARGCLADLLRSLGCKVREIHGEMAPDFAGLHPSPQEPWVDKCEQAVVAYGYDMGIVLDGDGDRAGIVDERGNFITSHCMVPLVMDHLVSNRGEYGRVVATMSSSARVRRQARRLGCPFTQVPMGFTRIYREFVEDDVLMGSEEYGGISYPEHLKERDGLYTALLMVEYLAMSKKKVSELVEELTQQVGSMHYVHRDVRMDAAAIQSFRNLLPGLALKEVCGKEPISVSHADGLTMRFSDDSWVQLRASRTEPVVRAFAEAYDAADALDLARAACDGSLRVMTDNTYWS
ncbi:MAG: phosphoglucomutase [Coriobacteriales bacterium]|nr:phosphoglucomutase [Coriobacteriales bacterium]